MSLTTFNVVSIYGLSCSKANVITKLCCISSQFAVSLRCSCSVYQFFGIPSNVWIKWCGHSSGGTNFHWIIHLSTCSLGCQIPSYFSKYLFPWSAPNLMHSNLLHWNQLLIFSLCSHHQWVGVAFKAISNTGNLLFFSTSNPNFIRNYSKSFRP